MTTARRALQDFYQREHLPAHGNVDVWVDWVTVFGRRVPFPNIMGRNKVLPYHDLHHLVTGYNADEAGEYELGAWCLAAGGEPLIGYLYDVPAVFLGLIRFPKRTLAAWRRGRHGQTLYHLPLDTLMDTDVDVLKAMAKVDA